MKALANQVVVKTARVNQLASDGVTPYTGIAPHQVSLNANANDEQRN